MSRLFTAAVLFLSCYVPNLARAAKADPCSDQLQSNLATTDFGGLTHKQFSWLASAVDDVGTSLWIQTLSQAIFLEFYDLRSHPRPPRPTVNSDVLAVGLKASLTKNKWRSIDLKGSASDAGTLARWISFYAALGPGGWTGKQAQEFGSMMGQSELRNQMMYVFFAFLDHKFELDSGEAREDLRQFVQLSEREGGRIGRLAALAEKYLFRDLRFADYVALAAQEESNFEEFLFFAPFFANGMIVTADKYSLLSPEAKPYVELGVLAAAVRKDKRLKPAALKLMDLHW